jgi:hypothetical protein
VLADLLVKKDGAHDKHIVDAVLLEKNPGLHWEHEDCPCKLVNVPFEHELHVVSPVMFPNPPGMHGAQIPRDGGVGSMYNPISHAHVKFRMVELVGHG